MVELFHTLCCISNIATNIFFIISIVVGECDWSGGRNNLVFYTRVALPQP